MDFEFEVGVGAGAQAPDAHRLQLAGERLDGRAALAQVCALLAGFPSRDLIVVGVTGTDGKTTTSTLIHSILQVATNGKAGLISTVNADVGGRTMDTGLHVTTPGAPLIQSLLSEMVANGLTHCVLEMTSHGLAQGRLNGVDVDVAVLTNVTHEHLDYHGSFEAYRSAKARMFDMLSQSYRKPGQPKVAVINADDPSADYFAAIPADRIMRYSLRKSPLVNIWARTIDYQPNSTTIEVFDWWIHYSESEELNGVRFLVSLVGEFNVMNALAAVAVAYSLDVDIPDIYEGLARVKTISGRLERIDEGQNFIAIVDFAHTPNALRNALEAARTMVAPGGRLIVVFGSAGLRDREKRTLMAEVSTKHADFSIFTAEDPRTESLDAILQTMADAATAAGGRALTSVPSGARTSTASNTPSLIASSSGKRQISG